jgi:hypothetical protein
MCVRRIGQRVQRQIDSAIIVLQRELCERPPRANRHVVTAGMLQPGGRNAADPTEADHGHGRPGA